MKIKIERCFNCNHHVITLVTKRWEEYECWKCGCGYMTIHRNVRDYPTKNQLTKGGIKMSPIEHYFENLLTMGSDIKGEPNKNALPKEVQEAIEICADYIKYNQLLNDTKADMVAMLTELKTEIEEIDSRAGYDGNGMPTFANDYIRIKKVNEIIQQKINALKGEENVDKT